MCTETDSNLHNYWFQPLRSLVAGSGGMHKTHTSRREKAWGAVNRCPTCRKLHGTACPKPVELNIDAEQSRERANASYVIYKTCTEPDSNLHNSSFQSLTRTNQHTRSPVAGGSGMRKIGIKQKNSHAERCMDVQFEKRKIRHEIAQIRRHAVRCRVIHLLGQCLLWTYSTSHNKFADTRTLTNRGLFS